MVNSMELGSYVQQVTAAFQQATQSSGASVETSPEQTNGGQVVKAAEEPVKQLNAGLSGEKPVDTDTGPGAYLDITA